MDFSVSVGTIVGSVIAVAGGILSIQKIMINNKKVKEEQIEKILIMAREEINLVKAKLESRIEGTKSDLKSLELLVNKDISHVRESHESEIKSLADKIENLRDSLNEQHAQMISLLSKLLDK